MGELRWNHEGISPLVLMRDEGAFLMIHTGIVGSFHGFRFISCYIREKEKGEEMKMKRWKTLCAMLGVMLLVCGCQSAEAPAQDESEALLERGYLVVGVDDTFAPMGFRDENNELTGYDIELARAVGEKLGVEMRFQTIDWSMKETELNAGNIDLIWNGYSITESRRQQVAFSEPYLQNRQLIITLADSDIRTRSDLAGRVVAVQKESSALEAVMADEALSASLQGGAPVEFDTNIDCFMDLEAGRSDAIVVDEVLARYVMSQRGIEQYNVLDEDFGSEEYGIGMRKSDQLLQQRINEAMEQCEQDGTVAALQAKWFGE